MSERQQQEEFLKLFGGGGGEGGENALGNLFGALGGTLGGAMSNMLGAVGDGGAFPGMSGAEGSTGDEETQPDDEDDELYLTHAEYRDEDLTKGWTTFGAYPLDTDFSQMEETSSGRVLNCENNKHLTDTILFNSSITEGGGDNKMRPAYSPVPGRAKPLKELNQRVFYLHYLHTLNLSGCPYISDIGLCSLFGKHWDISNLSQLSVSGCINVTDRFVEVLIKETEELADDEWYKGAIYDVSGCTVRKHPKCYHGYNPKVEWKLDGCPLLEYPAPEKQWSPLNSSLLLIVSSVGSPSLGQCIVNNKTVPFEKTFYHQSFLAQGHDFSVLEISLEDPLLDYLVPKTVGHVIININYDEESRTAAQQHLQQVCQAFVFKVDDGILPTFTCVNTGNEEIKEPVQDAWLSSVASLTKQSFDGRLPADDLGEEYGLQTTMEAHHVQRSIFLVQQKVTTFSKTPPLTFVNKANFKGNEEFIETLLKINIDSVKEAGIVPVDNLLDEDIEVLKNLTRKQQPFIYRTGNDETIEKRELLKILGSVGKFVRLESENDTTFVTSVPTLLNVINIFNAIEPKKSGHSSLCIPDGTSVYDSREVLEKISKIPGITNKEVKFQSTSMIPLYLLVEHNILKSRDLAKKK